MSLTDRIIAYGNCVKKEQQHRVGKYFCYISRMVGVQEQEDGTLFSGNIKPISDKFFVTIATISDEKKRLACDFGDYGLGWNFKTDRNGCVANFDLELSDESVSSFAPSHTSYSFIGIIGGSSFSLFGTGDFVWNERNLEGSHYLTVGKCEKID